MMMMMMMMIVIIQPLFNICSLCGRHFVYIIPFNFLDSYYKSGNHGLARLNNLTDVTQLLGDSSRSRIVSGESHALAMTFLPMTTTFGELGFYLDSPTPCLLTD